MIERAALLSLIETLGEARVLCVGDVILDHYQYGTVERISPEAPIPVLLVKNEEVLLGGAGNVLRNLVSLGVGARFAAAIGDDNAGREVLRQIAELEIDAAGLIKDDGRRTSTKTRYLAAGQQILRADHETVAPLSHANRRRLVEVTSEAMQNCDVVVLSDYGKGVLRGGVAGELIAAAHKAGKLTIVDPKGTDYKRYRGAGVLTPNRHELAEATRMPTGCDDEVAAAARRLIEDCALDAVLATRGPDGMTLVAKDGKPTHLKAEAREVFDVSGAGDTVVAALAAALAGGAALSDAAALANVAAGIVIGKVGTASADVDELVSTLHHQDLATAEAKVLGRQTALARIDRWRQKGLGIGFTNGCFDLLHPGHVSLLSKARAACDRLVVGLNSDASVARLKGEGRPLQSEAARATVLASLASVDMVVVFSEDDPLALIEATRPDVLVKGADWALDDVVGGDLVQGYGGRVLLVDLEPGFSTSATIARMAK